MSTHKERKLHALISYYDHEMRMLFNPIHTLSGQLRSASSKLQKFRANHIKARTRLLHSRHPPMGLVVPPVGAPGNRKRTTARRFFAPLFLYQTQGKLLWSEW